MKKLLIGGQALAKLGSSRYTSDVDYLINDLDNANAFIHDVTNNIDYINANGNKFFAEVLKAEANNTTEVASPQALLELKAYSLVQHCLNRNFSKADDAEYDIKFLVRQFGVNKVCIANKYITSGQLSEVVKVINSVKF